MAYKVYRKEKGSESVELVDDTVYTTKAEAEIAMQEAKSNLKDGDIPFPTRVPGSNQPPISSEEVVAIPGDSEVNEEEVEFFIREVEE